MPKITEAVTIRAEFAQDPTSGEWVATSMQAPRMSARGIEIRAARSALAAKLSERLGKPVQIIDKVKLSKGLEEQVAAYRRDAAKMQELKASLDQRFIPLIKALLRERLQHQQIATLLGVSKQWLSQALKQDATGSYRNRKK